MVTRLSLITSPCGKERSAHDEEYFSVEDHNSAIVLPKGSIYRLTGRYLTWEDDPISLKSVIEIDSL